VFEPDDTQFRDWLRLKLRARAMSIRLLAQRSGTSASTVSRIVRGERQASLRTAIRLIRVLGDPGDATNVPHLLSETPPRSPVGEVERALRSDERLSLAKVRRIMLLYHALRNEADDESSPERKAAAHR
jgi:transcriptional regulator with XRE-family HTH domain